MYNLCSRADARTRVLLFWSPKVLASGVSQVSNHGCPCRSTPTSAMSWATSFPSDRAHLSPCLQRARLVRLSTRLEGRLTARLDLLWDLLPLRYRCQCRWQRHHRHLPCRRRCNCVSTHLRLRQRHYSLPGCWRCCRTAPLHLPDKVTTTTTAAAAAATTTTTTTVTTTTRL